MENDSNKLKYKKAIINIIYSFTWDVTECDFNDLVESSKDIKNWKKLFLFERPLELMDSKKQAAYHPNIISQNLSVLHRYETINEDVEIIVPNNANGLIQSKIITKLSYSLRIYENGSGNCTFSFDIIEPSYYKINAILRLSSSIVIESKLQEKNYPTSSIIKMNSSLGKYFKENYSQIELIKIFDAILNDSIFPEIWKSKNLWFDKKTINNKNDCFNNWQTPYALSIIELDENDYRDFEDLQKKDTIKELGAIACRLSSENDKIETEYLKLKREYIFDSLGFYRCQFDEEKKDGIRLKNYSHHADLFYTIGKRGALAITHDLNCNPSYYAIPTLLNLVEILRSRWHLGSIVNLKLDDTLQLIARSKNLEIVLDDIFLCRALFGFFLQNPAPYLFDGGAITEIAEAGEETFWLKRLTLETERKFDVLDKLLKDQLERKRLNSLMEYYNQKSI